MIGVLLMLTKKNIVKERIGKILFSVHNVHNEFIPWLEEAEKRIFSLASGNRFGIVGPFIMRIGFAKQLYAVNELGVDIENKKPFVLFCPDGTVTFNQLRLSRGFTYGCLIKSDYEGLISPSSMPNGCGFSIFELTDDLDDEKRIELINKRQKELGKEHIEQLGKGNHFAALYAVHDPITGEDTSKRVVVVHCSGHAGSEYLYHPETWLYDTEGFYDIETPHGSIVLLEGNAKKKYLARYKQGDEINTKNRVHVMDEIFGENQYKTLEEITHQGLSKNGTIHQLGAQIHKGLQPIAFNAEEGLIGVTTKPNLKLENMSYWKDLNKVEEIGYSKLLSKLNITPHGGGYEFLHQITSFKLYLDNNGIAKFNLKFKPQYIPAKDLNFMLEATYFREIREYITFRRKTPLMKEVHRADLIKHIYDFKPLKQIYPLISIPGGSY